MTFINRVIDHLVHNGTMDPNVLFGPPFTDFHDKGVVRVLPQDAQSIVRTHTGGRPGRRADLARFGTAGPARSRCRPALSSGHRFPLDFLLWG